MNKLLSEQMVKGIYQQLLPRLQQDLRNWHRRSLITGTLVLHNCRN
ncbi:MAG: hypothetical protein KME50_30660 [Nostoc desertorum CM1-VF14]|nr:hypothetical protein [Nostoc desertorum CM1-VF14]